MRMMVRPRNTSSASQRSEVRAAGARTPTAMSVRVVDTEAQYMRSTCCE